MGDYSFIGKIFKFLYITVIVLSLTAVPLALWKLFDVIRMLLKGHL